MGQILLYDLAGADPELRFSPYCWKTKMALAHKGLVPDLKPWRFTEAADLPAGGHRTVPVLVDGSNVVSDSWQIARDLETRYPDRPSLFGRAGMGIAHFLNGWADMTLNALAARLVVNDVYKIIDAKDRDYFKASREKRFGTTLEEFVADRSTHLAAFRKALHPLRSALSDAPYLAGDAPNYADYCTFGVFMWIRCASPVEGLEADDPVLAWRDRLLDAFDSLARRAPALGK